MTNIIASTPGRICLFGEHQDYLGLPVIAAAISRRMNIEAGRIDSGDAPAEIRLSLPDVGSDKRFTIPQFPLTYTNKRDYFRSAINVLHRDGLRFSADIEGRVWGNIPINAGTSSSSALIVTWLNLLSQLADEPRTYSPSQLAEFGYVAEVLEFGEPGGMMDHYSTATGGIIYLESKPKIRVESFPFGGADSGLGAFVLGDSREPKDTIGVLRHVKYGMLDAMAKMRAFDPAFSLETMPADAITDYDHLLTSDERALVRGNLSDRDVLHTALAMFRSGTIDHVLLGQLLTTHQTSLREAKRVSTPKIDRMIDAALEAGALGGKINGSGGGGCMFAYSPTKPEAVAEAIEQAGGRAYVITVAEGTSVTTKTGTGS
ncbi:MAG: GHMP kinase [Rudanella sp.]|nr:GHMP kinase [Rudanella sp.]